MSKQKSLSKRQRRILDFVNEYIDENGRPPTIREIGRAADISSTSVVNYNLTKLTERGYVERDAEVSRGLRLTDKALAMYGKTKEALAEAADRLAGLVRIPLLGNIVAGEPIDVVNDNFAAYDEEDMVEVSASMISGKRDELFALRVSGDSMIDAMVNDGDIVIMKRQTEARNGDMIAALLEQDTTTLKYFYLEGDRVRLQPANPTMDPIYVQPEDVQVQGKVMMVMRSMI